MSDTFTINRLFVLAKQISEDGVDLCNTAFEEFFLLTCPGTVGKTLLISYIQIHSVFATCLGLGFSGTRGIGRFFSYMSAAGIEKTLLISYIQIHSVFATISGDPMWRRPNGNKKSINIRTFCVKSQKTLALSRNLL